MSTLKPTDSQCTKESLTSAPNIWYKDPANPTQDELYNVVVNHYDYLKIANFGDPFFSMCNYDGNCDTCPFTSADTTLCFVDSIDIGLLIRLRNSHPELFL